MTRAGAPVRHRAAAFVFAALALCATAARAEPREPALRSCPELAVRIVGASEADFHDICRGAGVAADFLERIGVSMTTTILFEVGPLPAVAGPTTAGCYVDARRRAHILDYAAFRRLRTWFHVPITRELYRSLAAHEAAHAIASCHFRPSRPTIQATEYIAYVTLFSTMPERLRAQALRRLPGTGFSDPDRITAIAYQFDPMQFGAQAYRHFIRQPDGATFIRQVLDGRLLND